MMRLQRMLAVSAMTGLMLYAGATNAINVPRLGSTIGDRSDWELSTLKENITPAHKMRASSYNFKRLEAFKASKLSEVLERWNQYSDQESKGWFEKIIGDDTVLDERLMGEIETNYGASARERIERWQTLASLPLDQDVGRTLERVNSFFNQTRFKSDLAHWGQEDYWATPLELLATNAGDCEDYAIAKYFTLKVMGVPAENLRITYVKALKFNQAHMVLAYYEQPDQEPLILDNLINEILPASKRTDLVPVYSFYG